MAVCTRRVRVSSKGQVVIPKEMRDRLSITEGDELVLYLVSDRVLVAEVQGETPLQKALETLHTAVDQRGITPEAVEEALADVRQETHAGLGVE